MGLHSWFGSWLDCWCIGMLMIFVHWFLYPDTLLKLLISLRRFWAETMEFSKYRIMSSSRSNNLTSLPIWILLTSYSSLVALTRTSNTMLTMSGERGHLCLVPVFKGNAPSFCPLSMILAVCLSYIALIILRYVPSIPVLLRVFNMKEYWILLKSFYSSIKIIM